MKSLFDCRIVLWSIFLFSSLLHPFFVDAQVVINEDEVLFTDFPITKFSDLKFTGESINPINGVYVFNQSAIINQLGKNTLLDPKTGSILVKSGVNLTVENISHSVAMMNGGLIELSRSNLADWDLRGGIFSFLSEENASIVFKNIVGTSTGYAYGGVFFKNGGTLNLIGTEQNPIRFENNSTKGLTARGGVLLERGWGITNIDYAHFIENSVYGTRNLATEGAQGGAIMADGTLKINNSLFKGNKAVATSGGMGSAGALSSIYGGVYEISNTLFVDNSAESAAHIAVGGAIHGQRLNLKLNNTRFYNNQLFPLSSNKAGYGGAVAIVGGENEAKPLFSGSKVSFCNNGDKNTTATINAGAVYMERSSLDLDSVNFEENAATNNSGALGLNMSPDIKLSRALFKNNSAKAKGGAIYSSKVIKATLVDAVFETNKADSGAAIFNNISQDIAINKSVFKKNKASKKGGAVYNFGGVITFEDCQFDGNTATLQGGAIYQEANKTESLFPTLNINVSSNEVSTFKNNKREETVSNSIYQFETGTINVDVALDGCLEMLDPIYLETSDDNHNVVITKKGKGMWYLEGENIAEKQSNKGLIDFDVEEGSLIIGKTNGPNDVIKNMSVSILTDAIVGGYGSVDTLDVKGGTIAPGGASEINTQFGKLTSKAITLDLDSRMKFTLGTRGATTATLGLGDYVHTNDFEVLENTYIDIIPKTGFGAGKYLLVKYAVGQAIGLDKLNLATNLREYLLALDISEDGSVYLIVTKKTEPNRYYFSFDDIVVCAPGMADLTAIKPVRGSVWGLTLTYYKDEQCTEQLDNPQSVGTGVYYIKGTDANGGYVTSVEVKQNPSPQFVFHTISIQSGETVNLKDVKPFVGSLEGLVIECYMDENCTQLVVDTEALTVGTYYIRGVNVHGCDFVASLIIQTIMVKPEIIYNDIYICESETVDLTVLDPEGDVIPENVTLTYYQDQECNQIVNTPTQVGEGIYYIKYVDEKGNLIGVYQVQIFTQKAPRIVSFTNRGGAVLCNDVDLISLEIKTEGGELNYTWYHNDREIQGVTGSIYEVPFSKEKEGTYYVKIEGRCSVVTSDKITIKEGFKPLVKWDDVLYVVDLENNYANYQWFKDGQPIDKYGKAAYYTDTEGLLGSYHVRVYYNDGTYSDSCPIEFKEKVKGASAKIYPTILNRNEKLIIDLVEPNDYENAKVEVYDFSGRLIHKNKIESSLTNIMVDWNAGTYIVKISLNNGRLVTKSIIIK